MAIKLLSSTKIGNFTLPHTDGVSGQALVTDGNGNISFAHTGGMSGLSFSNGVLTATTASGNITVNLDGRYALSSHTHAYDNYQSWNLKTNGVQRTTVQSGGTLDLVAGSNVTLSYGAGGVVTIAAGSSSGTVTSVSGTGTVSGLTLSGTVTSSGSLTLGGTLTLTSAQVTSALGFTPYNSTNPSGYITSSGSISGNAATANTLQTARTITIGSTGKTFNGSANVSWTLAEIGAQASGSYAASVHTHDDRYYTETESDGRFIRKNTWEGSAYVGTGGDFYGTIFYDSNNSGYYMDPASTSNLNGVSARQYYQSLHGEPRNNLGDPTVTDMALFDAQFNNKTEFYPASKVKFFTSSDGTNFTEYTGFSDVQKQKFMGGDEDSGVFIPNLTNRFRIELDASGYVFVSMLYMYWSSNSHSTKMHIWARRCDNQQWYQITSSDTYISSWPGHATLPFPSIAWLEGNTTSSGHHDKIRIEFIPSWSGHATYGGNVISLNRLQMWGGYPAGKRNVFTTYYDRSIAYPGTVSAPTFSGALSGNASTATSAATWTIGRTITIGNTGKTVNGSGDVSWTLAEIGAQAAGSYAAASHTHDDRYYTETETNNFFSGTTAISGYNKGNWDTAFGWGNHASAGYLTSASLSGYATQTYVNTAVANVINSAPAALDTLNELAAALGNDASFSTTVSTSLGNRLRVDTASQGLTGTQQSNARTNLGLGTAATSNTGDFATSGHSHSNATTGAAGFMSAADKSKLDGIASGATANSGTVTSVSGTGSYGGLTLSGTVTSSGSLTLGGTPSGTWPISVSGNAATATSATSASLMSSSGALTTQHGDGRIGYTYALTNPQTGLFAATDNANAILTVNRHPGDYYSQLGFSSNGNLYYRNFVNTAINTSQGWQTIWTSSSLTNLNQLSNGPGYTSNTGTVTSVSGTGTVSGLTLSGTVTTSGNLTLGGTLTLTSAQVTTALGFTPYNSTNPNGYITSSGSISGNAATATYATSAGTADQIDSVGFRNTGSNAPVNADTLDSNGITYYTGGVTNFSGNASDGALYSQVYSSSWQHQIAGDYRSGMIAVRGKNNGSWTGWRTIIDSSTIGSQSVNYATTAGSANSVAWGNVSGRPTAVSSFTNDSGYITSGSSISGSSRLLAHVDGPRDLSDRRPNWNARTATFDFVGAGTGNGSGNYAGILTFVPWDGTSASTGDSSYQLSFANQSGVNASGPARLSIRNGINSTWNSWQEILTSSNYNSYSPTLTGGNASGTWGISISGNAASASSVAWGNVSGKPSVATHRGEGSNYIDYARYVYNNGAYSGSGWIEPSDLGVRYAASSNYATSSGSCTGRAELLNGWGGCYNNSHPGYGLRAWYDWSNCEGYKNGITIGSNPGDTAYGFMLWQNMWDDRTYTKRWNGGWQSVRTLMNHQDDPYAANMNQYVRTSDSPTFAQVYSNGWFRNYGRQGMYNQDYGNHFYAHSDAYWTVAGNNGSAAGIMFRTGGHEGVLRGYVYVDSSNNIGFLNSGGSWSLRCDNSGNVVATGDVTAYSDARIKTEVKTVEDALDKVLALRGVTYKRTDIEDKSTKLGVIAQEVKEVLPEVVSENEDGMLTVSYGNMVGVLIEAMKEQQSMIETLEAKIELLTRYLK